MKLLVPIKIDDQTEGLIQYLAELSRKIPDCELFFLHVLKPENIQYDYDVDSTQKKHYKETFIGYKKLESIVQELLDKGIKTNDLVKKGIAHEVILKEADRLNVDMIVMGSHEDSAFLDLIKGSVKLKVLHESTKPVLVYPYKENS